MRSQAHRGPHLPPRDPSAGIAADLLIGALAFALFAAAIFVLFLRAGAS